MSEHLNVLRERIEQRQARIGVIGLGYVGLPVACLFADAGFGVVGIDIKPDRVAQINQGQSPIEGNEPGLSTLLSTVTSSGQFRATTDYQDLATADVITINVETPVDEVDHKPRYEALRAACTQLRGVLKEGTLVIVESTIAPGTMDRSVRLWLEKASGRRAGEGFFLGHCPERVMPGKLLANLRGVSRVVGGQTPEVAEVMLSLYRVVVRAELDASDMLTAELVKTTENAYRDVNIAFANEVALICQAVGGDVWKVRELVNKSPGRNMLLPGAGVGGHCIPKDPWLLAAPVADSGGAPLIRTARQVNDGMPGEVAKLALTCLRDVGVSPSQAKVAVLGYAYLEDSDDTRNSPTQALLPELIASGCQVVLHDPFVNDLRGDVLDAVRGADCAIVMVAHSSYRELDLARVASVMRQPPVMVDARHVLAAEALAKAGFISRRLGDGALAPTSAC